MLNTKPTDQTNQKHFDSFMDLEPVCPWSQSLRIMGECITIEQSKTCSVFVNYAGTAPAILALMVALCGIYQGHADSKTGRWYFHSQLQPCLHIAMLALQDKAPGQLVEDILNART